MRLALRVLRLARPHLGVLAAANVARLLATAADLGLLLLLRRLVDEALAAPLKAPLLRLGLVALALVAAREAASYLAGLLSARASTSLVRDLQDRLFGHIHGLSLEFFHRNPPGDLVSRLFHDAAFASGLVTDTTATALEAPVRLLGLFAVLWSLHPGMAAATALVLLPGVAAARLLARRLRARFRGLNEDLGGLYEAAYESLGAAETVKSLCREERETAEFVARNRAFVERQVGLLGVESLGGPLGQALRLAGVVAAFLYGAHEVGAGRLTPGGLGASLVAAYALLGALESLIGLYSHTQGALASAERLFAILDERPSVAAPANGRRATFSEGLRFEDVSFEYPRGARALEGIRLTLRPGEHLALVGPTGSGKTTLLRLALRLYDPTPGRVTLDGVDLRELDLPSLRALFAVVPQEALLFNRSIRDNIAYGRPSASHEEIEAAARLAGLDRVVAHLPRGYETVVGTRGISLAGGERQRVAIARAALRDAPILFLDEATSSLDSETEGQIQQALAALGRGRTIVTVAHRLSTLRGADRILVLEGGRLMEEGSHAELIARGGTYRRLCEAQGIAAR